MRAIYTGVTAVIGGTLGSTFLFWILAGVLQVCPISGLVIVWSLNPFLPMMTS